MKNSIQFLSTFMILAFLFLSSCTTDNPAPSPADPRTSFAGTWSVSETWNKLSYEVTITTDPASSTGVYIDNFAGAGIGVKTHGTISGSSIYVAPSPQDLGNGWVIENGTGYLTGTTKINWGYVFNEGATQYNATAVYTKK